VPYSSDRINKLLNVMFGTGEGDWNVPGTNSRESINAMRRLRQEVPGELPSTGAMGLEQASG